MANEPLLNGNQSVLDVIYQPYGSAIDRYAADGVGEIGGGQQGRLVHYLVVLHFQPLHGIDSIHHALLHLGNRLCLRPLAALEEDTRDIHRYLLLALREALVAAAERQPGLLAEL